MTPSSEMQQRNQLHDDIWRMANEVRGAVDGWDFKQFVLGMLFYRFMSESFAAYVDGTDRATVTSAVATDAAGASTAAAGAASAANADAGATDASASAANAGAGATDDGAASALADVADDASLADLLDLPIFDNVNIDALKAMATREQSDAVSQSDAVLQSNAVSQSYAHRNTVPSHQQIASFIKAKGYYIAPAYLFANVAPTAAHNANLNTELTEIFKAIESSVKEVNEEAYTKLEGLFTDFDTASSRLGSGGEEKSKRLARIISGVSKMNFGDFSSHSIDLFGDAYEFLISNYAANAGKSGGEFFTPQYVSKLLAKIALTGLEGESLLHIYDPACGSGSLLLQVKKQVEAKIKAGKQGQQKCVFAGQEINRTTYNLARANMYLHNVNYTKFDIRCGDTLTNPQLKDTQRFEVIVSNPPYSIPWVGSDNVILKEDPRFKDAGVLAPKSKADLAFVLHAVYHLAASGRAAIVCFPGILYRAGAEQKIRQYLIEQNLVETVIALPPNLFFGTSIAVNIMVLSKHKSAPQVQFIDASGTDFFKKEPNNNVFTEAHIDKIYELFVTRQDVAHLSKVVDNSAIAQNNYNLSVGAYVEKAYTRQVINIDELNSPIDETVQFIDRLRQDIDHIVDEIENQAF